MVVADVKRAYRKLDEVLVRLEESEAAIPREVHCGEERALLRGSGEGTRVGWS